MIMKLQNALLLLTLLALLLLAAVATQSKPDDQIVLNSNYITDKAKKEINEQLDKNNIEHAEKDEDYYWFTLHDYNKDQHLDGHELRAAFSDYSMENKLSLKEAEKNVDHIFEEDDLDNNGKISWPEYAESQAYHDE
ncbi:hypothetical protein RI367_002474 [Sorochytrium milnesiophthora]